MDFQGDVLVLGERAKLQAALGENVESALAVSVRQRRAADEIAVSDGKRADLLALEEGIKFLSQIIRWHLDGILVLFKPKFGSGFVVHRISPLLDDDDFHPLLL